MFDGISFAGGKAINESDMKLRPDLNTAYIDPFYQQTTLCLTCDVLKLAPDVGEADVDVFDLLLLDLGLDFLGCRHDRIDPLLIG